MKRYLALICIAFLLTGLAAFAKSPFHHTKSSPNFPMAYYTMNNNTLAHSMLAIMFEYSEVYPECRWQPFSAVNSLLYQGDLWIGKSSSPQNIVCSPKDILAFKGGLTVMDRTDFIVREIPVGPSANRFYPSTTPMLFMVTMPE
jgi:hypothetical protein